MMNNDVMMEGTDSWDTDIPCNKTGKRHQQCRSIDNEALVIPTSLCSISNWFDQEIVNPKATTLSDTFNDF